jgi:two-component system sensor histidine kinase KdpD
VIAGASSALLDMGPEADESRRKTLLTEVTEESQRLSRLVDNLLTMTKFDAGPMLVQKQWFPLEDVLGSALGRLRKEMTGRIVNKQLAPDLPLVPLDGVLIEQVLVNLMENALKYSGPDSPLDIFARQDDGSILVGVADRGPGLASGEEKNIFEKLYRGSASRTSDQRGAGLGLAIAQAIVNAHGGRVWAENRAGGGAVFWFTLPFEGSPPDLDTIEREGLQS